MKKIGGFLVKVGKGIKMGLGIMVIFGGLFAGFAGVIGLFEKICFPTIKETFFDE